MATHSTANRPLPLRAFCLLVWLGTSLALPSGAHAADPSRAATAADFKRQLAEHIMPYWYDTTIDREHGGYLLADDSRVKVTAREKQLVSQARMIWGFSHAHLRGLSNSQRDYLKAAEQGYRFLLKHLKDPEYGGYYWTTDLAGQPVNTRKIVYGQAFVIYGLVEYYRASGDPEALRHALEQYATLQRKAYDSEHGGWIEHFERDWTPILKPSPEAIVEVGGFKSANTHLHLMEAFTELYDVTRDPKGRRSLEESLRINMRQFYPRNPAEAAFHRQLDWGAVTAPSSAGLSYGHNVEFAWLMIRAEKALRRNPSWNHFNAYIHHALRHGYDHERGGLYNRGVGDQPATDTDKVWWVQSELLAALADGLQNQENEDWAKALNSLVKWINEYQADPKDRIWIDTLTADGKPKSTGKAHSWKANYHDVRALVKYIEVFGEPGLLKSPTAPGNR